MGALADVSHWGNFLQLRLLFQDGGCQVHLGVPGPNFALTPEDT